MLYLSLFPEILISRYFQTKLEEICKLFVISFSKAFINLFCQGENYIDPDHTCGKMSDDNINDCPVCLDDMLYKTNYERLCKFDEDTWEFFKKNTNMFITPDNKTSIFLKLENKDLFFNQFSKNAEQEDTFPFFDTNELQLQIETYNLESNQSEANYLDFMKRDSLKFMKIDLDTMIEKEEGDKTLSTNFITNGNNLNPLTYRGSKHENKSKHYNTKKLKISFLKDLNFKDLKRENIDKKLLRKSRKFLREKLKKDMINWDVMNLTDSEKNFWVTYLSNNLHPPFKFHDNNTNKVVEFKSFNTKFNIWLFSHKGSVHLFDLYLNEKFNEILNKMIDKFSISDSSEIRDLEYYIKNISNIYYSCSIDNENEQCSTNEDHMQCSIEVKNNEAEIMDNCGVFDNIKFDNM